MTSIGYKSTGSSVKQTIIPTPDTPGYSSLGRGLKGFIPTAVQTTDLDDKDVIQQRFQLVQAWNNSYKQQLSAAQVGRVITPFRAVNNSGDLLGRLYYSCGGSCQTFQSRPNLRGLKGHFGAIQDVCDGTNVPPAACNGRFVYDSSDYSRYLKQRAIGKNYNDLSYSGDDSHSQQSAIRAIRRY
jgi:hypothetical protein